MKNRSGEIPRPFSAQKFPMGHKWFFLSKRIIAAWRSGNLVSFAGFAKVAVTNQQESMKKAYGHRAPKGGAQNITSYGARVESACVCVEFVRSRLRVLVAWPNLFFLRALLEFFILSCLNSAIGWRPRVT